VEKGCALQSPADEGPRPLDRRSRFTLKDLSTATRAPGAPRRKEEEDRLRREEEDINNDIRSINEQVSKYFKTSPQLFYSRDLGRNAGAMKGAVGGPEGRTGSGDGTVFLGEDLLSSTFFLATHRDLEEFGLTVAAVLAHEYGHIRQYAKGSAFKPGKHRELHADYLAGWYFRKMKEQPRWKRPLDDEEVFGFTPLYRVGDTNFTSERHHGTKEERNKAFLAGFKCDGKDIDAAYQNGLEYISSLE
jgi:hypothetical protein